MERSKPVETRRAAAAVVLGNVLEWYDLIVYSYLATFIAKNFFAPGNEAAALLDSFAAFGLGLVARPFGAILIGWLGDKIGRKPALILSILLMAGGTVAIGIVPAYGSIGLLAPAILVLARLVQGFSVGGEWGNAIAYLVELAPAGRRGYYSSWQQCSLVGGLLLGSGVAALLNTSLTTDAMESWGWRIPFLLGGLIGPVAVYMRRNIDESEVYRRAATAPPRDSDAIALFNGTAQAFGVTISWAVQAYLFLIYMPTFTQKFVGLSHATALWFNTAALLVLMLTIPLIGHLSDRIGRKPVLLAGSIAFIVFPYPMFSVMLATRSPATILVIQLLTGIAIALYCGAAPAAIAELFMTRTRTTLMSIGNGAAVAIFGGFAPFIATWLIARTGSPMSPAFYVIASAAVSAVAILGLRESARNTLR